MRILVAEDEKDLSSAICEVLQLKGFEVDSVYDGEDALFYSNLEDYDLIILDVMMPKMDGFQVVQKIREEGNNTPVIILTAKSRLEDKVSGLNYGADDYLTKPFEFKELLARINALLRRPKQYISKVLELEGTKLDMESLELIYKDKSVKLNNKESQMMEFFMINPKHLFSKEVLFDKIWGLDVDSEINVVWVNISSLRKKLSQINSPLSINSIRGVGYKLE